VSYQFHVDRFDSRQLAGWIFHGADPAQAVPLELEADGEIALRFSADRPRDDLIENGIAGHGGCAFDVDLAGPLAGKAPESLVLRVAGSDSVIAVRTSEASRRSDAPMEGLWVDRDDFLVEAIRRREKGRLSLSQFYHCVEFAVKGYTILEGAVRHELVDRINADIDAIWARGDTGARIETYQDGGTLRMVPARPEFKGGPNKLLDLYVFSAAAREAVFSPVLGGFLTALFDEPATAFQSLSFLIGSEQPIHKDTAFVPVDPPLKLAASWMALQDVSPGTGELEYFVGSHRDSHYLFGKETKCAHSYEHEIGNYLQSLQDDARVHGHEKGSFLARKGDVLVWHADLAHGGAKIRDPAATRKSLVTHYCPRSAKPVYGARPHPELPFGEHLFTSGVYPVDFAFRDGVLPPGP
jgi:hypothetical protein